MSEYQDATTPEFRAEAKRVLAERGEVIVASLLSRTAGVVNLKLARSEDAIDAILDDDRCMTCPQAVVRVYPAVRVPGDLLILGDDESEWLDVADDVYREPRFRHEPPLLEGLVPDRNGNRLRGRIDP